MYEYMIKMTIFLTEITASCHTSYYTYEHIIKNDGIFLFLVRRCRGSVTVILILIFWILLTLLNRYLTFSVGLFSKYSHVQQNTFCARIENRKQKTDLNKQADTLHCCSYTPPLWFFSCCVRLLQCFSCWFREEYSAVQQSTFCASNRKQTCASKHIHYTTVIFLLLCTLIAMLLAGSERNILLCSRTLAGQEQMTDSSKQTDKLHYCSFSPPVYAYVAILSCWFKEEGEKVDR